LRSPQKAPKEKRPQNLQLGNAAKEKRPQNLQLENAAKEKRPQTCKKHVNKTPPSAYYVNM